MDRRTFLTTTATGAIVASTGLASVAAAGTPLGAELEALRPDARILRAGLSVGFSAPYFADIVERFADAVVRQSGGRLGLAFAAPTGDDRSRPRSARADVWFCLADELSTVDGAFAYFGGLPMGFGLSADWHEAWLGAAGGQLFWDELGTRYALKPLSIGHTGASPGAWLAADWISARDLVTTRAAASGAVAAVLRGAGVDVVVMPPAAQAKALAEGHVTFVEPALPAVAAIAAGFGAGGTARHLRTGIASSGSVLACGIAGGAWADLDQSEQSILTAAAAMTARETSAEIAAHQALVAPRLRQSRGIASTGWTAEVEQALRSSAAAMLSGLAARDAETRRLHEAYFGFRQAATGLADPLAAASGLA